MTAMVTLPTTHPQTLDALMAHRTRSRSKQTPLAPPKRLSRPDILEAASRLATPLAMRDMRHSRVLSVGLERRDIRMVSNVSGRDGKAVPLQDLCD
jgi:hypothetical protein